MSHDFFRVLDISASALTAERVRVSVITQNIANASSLAAAPEQEPYRRHMVLFESLLRRERGRQGGLVPPGGVRVKGVVADDRPFPRVHRPGHPGADAQGWVAKSNVELPLEMVDLLDASRSYEANLTALRLFQEMFRQTLQIAR